MSGVWLRGFVTSVGVFACSRSSCVRGVSRRVPGFSVAQVWLAVCTCRGSVGDWSVGFLSGRFRRFLPLSGCTQAGGGLGFRATSSWFDVKLETRNSEGRTGSIEFREIPSMVKKRFEKVRDGFFHALNRLGTASM